MSAVPNPRYTAHGPRGRKRCTIGSLGEKGYMMSSVKAAQSAEVVSGADAPVLDEHGNPWVAPSWEEVVTTYSPKVYRLAYRLTGNRFDAEDLTQEVFVRVFRSLANFKPGTLDGWLHRITTNLFLDQARRKTRIRFDGLTEEAESRLPSKHPGPERSFEFNNLDIDVQAALEELPPDFRAAVVLCDLEGLAYDEVAQVLGVKLGTVRSRIHRGRTMLREKLAHRDPRTSGGSGTALGVPRIAGLG